MPKDHDQDFHLSVSLATQTMELWRGRELLKSYPVSTSKFGPGTEEGSFKTPLGSFEICEKFGADAPIHTIFKSREAVGEWDPRTPSESDLVLARILRLNGLDEDNANSYQRFIYIHGTNHEDLIGSPASQGCVRMRNEDIIELFNLIPAKTTVLITER